MGRDVNRWSSVNKPETLRILQNVSVFGIEPELFWILCNCRNTVYVKIRPVQGSMSVQVLLRVSEVPSGIQRLFAVRHSSLSSVLPDKCWQDNSVRATASIFDIHSIRFVVLVYCSNTLVLWCRGSIAKKRQFFYALLWRSVFSSYIEPRHKCWYWWTLKLIKWSSVVFLASWRARRDGQLPMLQHPKVVILTFQCWTLCSRWCSLCNSKLICCSQDWALRLQVSPSKQIYRFHILCAAVVLWWWPVSHQFLFLIISGFCRFPFTRDFLADLPTL